MKILLVDACVRGHLSRTKQLLEIFKMEMLNRYPSVEIVIHDLYQMDLQPLNAETLAKREMLCDAFSWSDDMIQPAKDFVSADLVVIAAPYWDLSSRLF